MLGFNWHEALIMIGQQFDILFGAQLIYGIFLTHNGTITNVNEADFIEYSSTDKFYSAEMEFKNMSGNEFMTTWMVQFQYIGMFIGSLAGGLLADLFGRKPTLIVSLVSCSIILIGSGFVNDPILLVVLRMLTGIGAGATLVIAWTLTTEMVQPKTRFIARAFFNWPSGRLILTLICFLTQNWRFALFVFGGIGFMTALLYLLAIPESPTWLQKRGRTTEAKEIRALILKRSAYKCDIVLGDTTQIPFRALIQMPRLRNTFILLSFMWACNSYTSVVTDFGFVEILGIGSFFLSQVLISAICFGAKAVLGVFEILTGYVNRRNLHLISLVGSTVFYLAAGLVLAFKLDQKSSYFFAVPYIIGLITTEFCWDACYLCVIELMPTEMRATAAGACSLIARIGAVCATLTLKLSLRYKPSSLFIVSALGAINFVIIFFTLQETKSVHLGKVGSRKISSRRPSTVDVFPEPEHPRKRSLAEEEYDEIVGKKKKSTGNEVSPPPQTGPYTTTIVVP